MSPDEMKASPMEWGPRFPSFTEPQKDKGPHPERWPAGAADAFLAAPPWVGGSPIRVASCSGMEWVAAASPSGVLVLARGQGRALPMAGALPAVVESAIATSLTEPGEDGLPAAVATVVRLLRAVHQDLRQENRGSEEGLEALIAVAIQGRIFVINAGGGATFRRRRHGQWETLAPVGDRARPVLGTGVRALIEVASEPLRAGDLVLALASASAEIVTAEKLARSAITAWASFQNLAVSPLAGDPAWALLLHGEPHGLLGPDLFPGRSPLPLEESTAAPERSTFPPEPEWRTFPPEMSTLPPGEISLRDILRADAGARTEAPPSSARTEATPFSAQLAEPVPAAMPLLPERGRDEPLTFIQAEQISTGDLVSIEILPASSPAPATWPAQGEWVAQGESNAQLAPPAKDASAAEAPPPVVPLLLSEEIPNTFGAAPTRRSYPWRRRATIGFLAAVLGAVLALGVRHQFGARVSDSISPAREGRTEERRVNSAVKEGVGTAASGQSTSGSGASAVGPTAPPLSPPAPIAASSSPLPPALPGAPPGSAPGPGAFAPGFGGLSIRTEPAASDIEVFLDEKPVGRAPLGLDHVAPGRHRVRFRGPDHYHWDEEVMVRSGEMAQAVALIEHVDELAQVTVRSSFLDERGLQAQQGDEVTVDGTASGKTPVDIDLEPGVHAIAVKRKGTSPIIRVVELRRSDRLIVDVRVDEDPPFTIEHTPPGGTVRAEGTLLLTVQCRGLDPASRPKLYFHYAIDQSWDRLPMGEVPGALGTYVIGLPMTPDRAKKKLRYYFSTGPEGETEPVYSSIFSIALR